MNLTVVCAFVKHRLNANDPVSVTTLHKAAFGAVAEPGRRREAAGVVDLLLRSGADETLVDDGGLTAEDLANTELEESAEHESIVERVRELLANAPADKAWRRRGPVPRAPRQTPGRSAGTRQHPDASQKQTKCSQQHLCFESDRRNRPPEKRGQVG